MSILDIAYFKSEGVKYMQSLYEQYVFYKLNKYIECTACIGTGAWDNESNHCYTCDGEGGAYIKNIRAKRRLVKKKAMKIYGNS